MTDNDMLKNYFADQELVVPVASVSSDDADEEDDTADVDAEHQHLRNDTM